MNKSFVVIIIGAGLLLAIVAAVFIWYPGGDRLASDGKDEVVERGIALFDQQSFPEALAELEKIPAGQVDDWRVPYYIGSAHMMLKDYRLAADSLEQALALNSHESGILYALGVVYYKLGNLKLAKAYFASVLEINPADKQAKGLMDIMNKLEQQSAEAAEALSEEEAPESGS